MCTPSRCVLTLELDAGAEPLAGVVCDEAGNRCPFTGWLGLASALEAAMRTRSSEQAGTSCR
jgi:hypothetical protein